MSKDITSALKFIEEVRKAVSLISEKIEMLESDIKLISKESITNKEDNKDTSLTKTKRKTNKTIVRRIDDAEDNTPSDKHFQQPKYDIKVVGLGVEKIKE